MTPERRSSLDNSWRIRRLLLVGALLVGMATAGLGVAFAMPSAADAFPPKATTTIVRLTLVTGDRVELRTTNGHQDATVLPRPGEHPAVLVQRRGGHVHVIPAQVRALLAAGKLDPRLFDVTQLAADGFTSDRRLPLLVAAPGGLGATSAAAPATAAAPAKPPAAPAGSTARRTLPRLGMTAVEVTDPDRFWAAASGEGTAPATRAAAPDDDLAAGIGKLWLDGRVHASLDRSVPQIGGPAARAKGLDGTGVTVAVLDTGIDDQNADVAPKVTASSDFSGEGGTDDGFGHGTHVASIIAGTGANSGGKYAGVAPKASLIDGRVLDSSGSGSDSGVLAGMEWAAPKARVINMSLGAYPTDGTDPLSLAVDSLTAQFDTLFVIAAGNSGDGGEESTVDSPGTATSALTVGAVDRDDTLADFSSRGPRLGGSLLKPEITAPGVDIVAAQADGTQLGDVIAPGYIALSGTSMATPHVAGSAALLVQQHGDWSAAALKAQLVSRATPHEDTPIFAQGAGRVDLAKATADGVRVDAGTIDLGFFDYPHGGDAPVTRQLTYRNDGPAPAAVQLTATLADAEGTAAPAGALAIDATSFTLAAGATRTVTLTATPDALGIGRWSGAVTATTSAGTTRTVMGLVKESERYPVEVTVLGRDGKPSEDTFAEAVDLLNGRFYDIDTTRPVRLPPSTYRFSSYGFTVDGDAASLAFVTKGDVKITKAAAVTLDARGSVPYRVSVQRPDAAAQIHSLGYAVVAENGDGLASGFSFLSPAPESTLWAKPTPAARTGTFEFDTVSYLQPNRLAAVVEGSGTVLAPEDVWDEDRLEGRHTVEVVAPPTPVRGAFALLDPAAGTSVDDAVAAAAAAGATGAVLPYDAESFPEFAAKPAVPTFALPRAQWEALAGQAGAGSVRVTLVRTTYPPYTYNLAHATPGRVPANLTYRFRDTDLARAERTFRSHGAGGTGVTYQFPLIAASGFANGQEFRHGAGRTDFLSPGLRWQVWVDGFVTVDDGWLTGRAPWTGERTYPRGRFAETYAGQVSGPALPKYYGDITRLGDEVAGFLVPWTDSAGRPAGFSVGDAVHWTLRSGGATVAEGADPSLLVQLPPARARYALEVTGTREAADGVALSTGVKARWTFGSATVAGDEPAPLQLLSLDAPLPLDITNSTPRGSTLTFTLTGRLPAGVPAKRVTSLAVESSSGGAWTAAKVTRTGPSTFTVQVRNPRAGLVSLRMTAASTDGISVRQEVTKAYRVR